MTADPERDDLRFPIKTLERRARRFATVPRAELFISQLERARHSLRNSREDVDRPLLAVITGGVQTGKTTLFHALVRHLTEGAGGNGNDPAASRQPLLAAAAGRMAQLPLATEDGVSTLNAPLGHLALVDSPALDSYDEAERETAHRLVAHADVVIYVNIPDNRASFELLDQVRRHRATKRWFFVLNKMDRAEAPAEELREDFDRRLRELGFHPGPDSRFLLTALQPARFDFRALAAKMDQWRGRAEFSLSREDHTLSLLVEATKQGSLRPLRELERELEEELDKQLTEIRGIYEGRLREPKVQEEIARLAKAQAWGSLARSVPPPLSWAMGLANRLPLLFAGYHLTRMATGSVGLLRLAQFSLASLAAAARGLLPVMHIASLLNEDARMEMERVRRETRRFLEDKGLTLLPPPEAREESADDEPPATEPGGGMSRRFARAFFDEGAERLGRAAASARGNARPDMALVQPLQRSIEESAQRMARDAHSWVIFLLADLVPVAALLHVLYRIGEAWTVADYLPLRFYAMAIVVLLASFIPGFVIMRLWLGWRGGKPDANALIQRIETHPATEELEGALEGLRDLLSEAHVLNGTFRERRRRIDSQLGGLYGQTVIAGDAGAEN